MSANNISFCKSSFYNKYSLSQITLFFVVVALVIYKFVLLPHENMITWDNFGYYLYLPKIFIYNDPFMGRINEWLYPVIEKYQNTPHLYQTNPIGDNHIIRYAIGQSVFYAPFFFIAHVIALITPYPADGFSLIYQVVLRWGCFMYVVAGLFLFRKVLLAIFDDKTTALLLVLLTFGANLHVYAGSLSPHETLFFVYALMLYITVKRKNYYSLKFWIAAAALAGLACITRPTDVIIGLIPLLWGMDNWKLFFRHVTLFFTKKGHIVVAALFTFCAVLFIQLLYWKILAGKWVYYTYETTEEILHLTSPFTVDFLFSFRKGWFVYSPLMLLAFFGFMAMYQKRREVFVPVFLFYVLNIYLVSSWTSWWYADSFSSRAMVQTLAVSIIPLGFLLQYIRQKSIIIKSLFLALLIALLSLNLFQTWQFHKYIFPLDRLTKEAYAYIFLKTKIDVDKREALMLINRNIDETYIPNVERYSRRTIAFNDYENEQELRHQLCDTLAYSGSYSLKLDSDFLFSNVIKAPYKALTDKPHLWFKSSAMVYFEVDFNDNLFSIVNHFQHKGANYKYRTGPVHGADIAPMRWNYVEFLYLSPELKSKKDIFLSYFWLRGDAPIWIDDFKVEVFEPQ